MNPSSNEEKSMTRHSFLPVAASAVALLFCAVLPGCVTYHLGSMLPPDIRTVYVPTCRNQTSEPFLEQDVTSALMAAIQMDGSLKLVSDEEHADAVLYVNIYDFLMEPVGYESGSGNTVEEYRMTLVTSIVLQRTSNGAVVVESPMVKGWEDFDFTGDLTSSKAVALRPAADDLGRRIVNEIVMYWPESSDPDPAP